MVRVNLILLFMFSTLISCETVDTQVSEKLEEKQAVTNEGEPGPPPAAAVEELIADPGERYNFSLSLVNDFGLSSIISFSNASLRIHEKRNGVLAGYFEYSDTLGNWAMLFTTDKEGKILKSQKFPRFFRRVDQLIQDRFGSFYLRGAPAVSGANDEIIQKYNSNLELQWQNTLEQVDQSGVLMLLKNDALYFMTHQGPLKKDFVVLKYNPVNGLLIQRSVHAKATRPLRTYSSAVEPYRSSIQMDRDTFHYIYRDRADDTSLYTVYVRYSFDLDQFLVDQNIFMSDVPAAGLTICYDRDGGFFTFHSSLHLLSRYSAFGDLIFQEDIRNDFQPHIVSGGMSMRCQNEELEIFGSAQQNEINTNTIMISTKFSKSNGGFLSSQLLKMRESRLDQFSISGDINGQYHFYHPERIPAEMDYDIHFSGVNF